MKFMKLCISMLFVLILSVPLTLGAVPVVIESSGYQLSFAALEASAKAKKTKNNTLKNITVPTSGAKLNKKFKPGIQSYTINLGKNQGSVKVKAVAGNKKEKIRYRVDSGKWSSWKGAGKSCTATVKLNQGQNKKLKFSVRDDKGNTRTYTINVKRAGSAPSTKKATTSYESIYNDYSARLRSSGSSDINTLAGICNEGIGKMAELMWQTTGMSGYSTYETWALRLTDVYMEVAMASMGF